MPETNDQAAEIQNKEQNRYLQDLNLRASPQQISSLSP